MVWTRTLANAVKYPETSLPLDVSKHHVTLPLICDFPCTFDFIFVGFNRNQNDELGLKPHFDSDFNSNLTSEMRVLELYTEIPLSCIPSRTDSGIDGIVVCLTLQILLPNIPIDDSRHVLQYSR